MDIDQRTGGWQPDLPDHRDYVFRHATVQKLLQRSKLAPAAAAEPARVDLREFCPPIQDQGALPTSCVHACVALVQHFERRSTGQFICPSRLFIHANAHRLLGQPCDHSLSLRTVLKAMVRFGAPPEEYAPYEADRLMDSPSAFTYGFAREFNKIRYLRLDDRRQGGDETLRVAKTFLAASFPCALGFPVSTAVTREPEIPFPAVFDGIRTGMAVLAVGYDDNQRILSEKGGILVRNSWGGDWGDGGYGWLPYSYLRERLAVDVWTLLKRSWLNSGEFRRPKL